MNGSMNARHQSLQQKHAQLEAELQSEMQRSNPDTVTIQSIKKRKLQIKQQLASMMEPG